MTKNIEMQMPNEAEFDRQVGTNKWVGMAGASMYLATGSGSKYGSHI